MAEFFRRGRPLGLAKAPSSLARSWRMGWTRMTWPSLDSCTEAATMETSMAVRAQRRPAAYGVPAKLTTPCLSASRVTVSPAVASPVVTGQEAGRPWKLATADACCWLPLPVTYTVTRIGGPGRCLVVRQARPPDPPDGSGFTNLSPQRCGKSPDNSGRCDVRVHPEQVRGVVLGFQPAETSVVGSVGGADLLWRVICGDVVDIGLVLHQGCQLVP